MIWNPRFKKKITFLRKKFGRLIFFTNFTELKYEIEIPDSCIWKLATLLILDLFIAPLLS